MDNETNRESYNDFEGSPLDKALKGIGSAIASTGAGGESSLVEDDFSGFLRVDRVIKKILRFFCWLSAVALIIVMMIAVINVVGEKLAQAGVSWSRGIPNNNGLIQYFHIPLVFLAAGYVTLDQGHTRIDLLIQKVPVVEKIFMLLGHILGAGLAFFISYRGVFGVLLTDFAQHKHITTSSTSPLAWPFTVCHCVGFFLLGFSFIWAIVRMIRFWKYPGVNPGMILYPDEHKDPFGGDEPEGGDAA